MILIVMNLFKKFVIKLKIKKISKKIILNTDKFKQNKE